MPHDAGRCRTRLLRRSLLVTPGDNVTLIHKLGRSHADVAILELEDGVHPDRKDIARHTTAKALRSVAWGSKETIVRINAMATPEGRRDLEIIVPARPTAIMLPKLELVRDVRIASDLIAEFEAKAGLPVGGITIWAQVETARGVVEVDRLVFADPRMDGVLLGCGDLSADMSVKRIGIGKFRRPSADPHELLYSRGRVVAASRAAGIDCFDTASIHLRDLETLRARAEYSAQMGFSGVIVVSPRHVATINSVFSPPPEDIVWATQVIALAGRRDRGSAERMVLDDDLIDGSMLGNARQILARRDVIDAFTARRPIV